MIPQHGHETVSRDVLALASQMLDELPHNPTAVIPPSPDMVDFAGARLHDLFDGTMSLDASRVIAGCVLQMRDAVTDAELTLMMEQTP